MKPAYCQHLNTSAPGDFVEKTPVKTNRVVFWSTKTIYKTPAIRWLLLQLLNCSFGCSSRRKRQNFGHLYFNRNRDLQRCHVLKMMKDIYDAVFKDAVFQSSCIPGDLVLLFFIAVDQN